MFINQLDGGMIEHEHDTVFIGQSKKLPKLNPSEASDYMYLNVKDLVAYIQSNPEIFTLGSKSLLTS